MAVIFPHLTVIAICYLVGFSYGASLRSPIDESDSKTNKDSTIVKTLSLITFPKVPEFPKIGSRPGGLQFLAGKPIGSASGVPISSGGEGNSQQQQFQHVQAYVVSPPQSVEAVALSPSDDGIANLSVEPEVVVIQSSAPVQVQVEEEQEQLPQVGDQPQTAENEDVLQVAPEVVDQPQTAESDDILEVTPQVADQPQTAESEDVLEVTPQVVDQPQTVDSEDVLAAVEFTVVDNKKQPGPPEKIHSRPADYPAIGIPPQVLEMMAILGTGGSLVQASKPEKDGVGQVTSNAIGYASGNDSKVDALVSNTMMVQPQAVTFTDTASASASSASDGSAFAQATLNSNGFVGSNMFNPSGGWGWSKN